MNGDPESRVKKKASEWWLALKGVLKKFGDNEEFKDLRNFGNDGEFRRNVRKRCNNGDSKACIYKTCRDFFKDVNKTSTEITPHQ